MSGTCWRRWLWWVAVILVAVWGFYAYSWFRTRSGPIGFDLARSVGFAGASVLQPSLIPIPPYLFPPAGFLLVLAPLLVWAWDHLAPDRKFAQHPVGTRCCEACGYPADGLPSPTCPECGSTQFLTTRRRRGVKWAAWLLAAWFVGCTLGEANLLYDEHAFMTESRTAAAGYWRLRRHSPYYGELSNSVSGFWCVDD